MDINLYDITGRPELAKQMRMFYPTLTVVNNRFRHYSPVTQKFLEAFCNGVILEEAPYRPRLGTKEFTGDILPITSENYELTGACTGRNCRKACERKVQFLQDNDLTVYGFMNVQGNELLGGAEYMPSKLVPYDILKDEKTAFLTCVYLSDETYDYKSAPLRALEKYLAKVTKKL